MVFCFDNFCEINNELSSLLRALRTRYHNEIKLRLTGGKDIREFKVNILRERDGLYKFLFLVRIPKYYPLEPMWAEPAIVAKKMLKEFAPDDFKSHKLRPLIDHLFQFCQKFVTAKNHEQVITYSSSQQYGVDYGDSKFFIMPNETVENAGNPVTTAIPNQIIYRRGLPSNYSKRLLFYNEMGIDILKYVAMFNKYRVKTKKYSLRRNLSKEQFYKNYLMIKSTLQKNVTDLSRKDVKANSVGTFKDISYCQLNLGKIRHFVTNIYLISNRLNSFDFLDNLTVGLGEDIYIDLRAIYTTLIFLRNDFFNFVSCVNSFIIKHGTELLSSKNNVSFSVMTTKSRQILSPNLYSKYMEYLCDFFNCLKLQRFPSIDHKEAVFQMSLLDSIERASECVLILLFEQQNSFLIANDPNYFETYDIRISPIIIEVIEPWIYSSRTDVYQDSHFVRQFMRPKKPLPNLCPSNDQRQNPELFQYSRSLWSFTCSEVISEIIYFPKQSCSFEYVLELNPRDRRHCVLLDSMGLLEHKSQNRLEIVAPNDYNTDSFFVKEIVHCKSGKILIRLYKMVSNNLIFKLVKEENEYFKQLFQVNRTISYMAKTAEFDLIVVSSVCTIITMYMRKLYRNYLILEEASKLKCSVLPIRRVHFYKEFVESLSMFGESF